MLDLILKTLLAYLLGSMLGSLIVGRLKGGVDIRHQGSGNAGGTNALRTQGWQFALWVMVIDIGKGWLAVSLLPLLELPFVPFELTAWTPVACAIAAVVGHVFPIWFGFRGGKGAATLVGVVGSLTPMALPYVLSVWLLVVMFTGYVGLSTLLATLSFNAWVVIFGSAAAQVQLLTFSISMSVFVIYTHRANIVRMHNGTEHRAQRIWLFKHRSRPMSRDE